MKRGEGGGLLAEYAFSPEGERSDAWESALYVSPCLKPCPDASLQAQHYGRENLTNGEKQRLWDELLQLPISPPARPLARPPTRPLCEVEYLR